jgi:deoxyribonuclease-4
MLSKQRGPRLGAHVSTAGGLLNAVGNAEKLGAVTIQIFGASPRQWSARLPLEAEIREYREALLKSDIGSVYLHAAYLVNLASGDRDLYEKSIENLSSHLKIAELIGAKGLIFHLGSSGDQSRDRVLGRVVDGMRSVLKRIPGNSMLLMENSSGGGNKVGASPEELGKLLIGIGLKRVGICLDTAHAYEAGQVRYEDGHLKEFIAKLDANIGLDAILVIHANDSKTDFNSGLDRHANIGQGYIGLDGFGALAREKGLWDKDWILEVPGFAGHGPDKRNLELLRSCFS